MQKIKDGKKIGIMTMHCVPNYGAIMQSFASKLFIDKQIKEHGNQNEMSVEIIDYQPVNKKIKYSDTALVTQILAKPKLLKQYIMLTCNGSRRLSKTLHKKAYDFYYKNNVLSENISRKKLNKLESDYLAIIVGSDQVWNPYGMELNNPFLLGFANNILKYSFASSFGIKVFPHDYAETYKTCLNEFSKLSVRESEGVSIVKQLTDRDDCLQMLDPTLLLDKSDYLRYENKNRASCINGDYVLVYMAMKSDSLIAYVLDTVEDDKNIIVLGMPEVVSSIKSINSRISIIRDASPEEFLGFFDLSSKVYTNSFHGIAFSIIYEKPIYIEYNDKYSKSNSRLENIVRMFGLENRIITNNNFADEQELDFCKIKEIREEKKILSKNYIDYILNEIGEGQDID